MSKPEPPYTCPTHGVRYFILCRACTKDAFADTPSNEQLWLQRDRPETLEHEIEASAQRLASNDSLLPARVDRALSRVTGCIIVWALGFFGWNLIAALLRGKP